MATARSGAVMFDQEEVVHALEERGFEDVRVRVAGVTQFVGAASLLQPSRSRGTVAVR